MTESTILVVAAEPDRRRRLAGTLYDMGFAVEAVAEAPETVDGRWLAAVFGVGSVSDAGWRNLAATGLPTVLVAARAQVRDAVTALRGGASDFLVEPFDEAALGEALPAPVDAAVEGRLIASDAALKDVTQLAARVAGKDISVLLTGESGTGKELFARFIHEHSDRAAQPFVAVNCAAIPENMLEAVLFGYEKGAFTGAHRSHAGKFEQAQGGTLLLDEVSEIDAGLQAKLLRVLQEREVERLCGTRAIPLDVRVVATTNRDLRAMVRSGEFREDLYYRLHVFPLHIPPLRERTGDILPLARSFLRRYGGSADLALTEQAEQLLLAHEWPGNVRELENVVQRAVILADGLQVGAGAIRFDAVSATVASPDATADLEAEVRSSEHRVILDTLQRVNGSRKAAAERLGISDRTLRYKLARMRRDGLSIPARFGAECA
ncbi:sigma-54-dependent Fis family transcriptional regulator [Ectothiorhodospiraceae bacterium WFHF3C12]|nr:sigma-54-dependent Fis family transcriptional regulator [Ectothiorhodospiraceae bacterium WFHF3C12]